MNIPKIDKRKKEDIIRQIQEMAPHYAKTWRFDKKHPDAGSSLAIIFAEMLEDTISRLNQLPYKKYLEFLNNLGIKFRAAIPSKGYLSFFLDSRAEEGVQIPAGVKAYCEDGERGRIIFETVDDLYAVNNNVACKYYENGQEDYISIVEDTFFKEDKENNLQEHILYIGQEQILNLSNGKATVSISFHNDLSPHIGNEMAKSLTDNENVKFEYYSGNKWEVIETLYAIGNSLELVINEKTMFTTVEKEENYFIRCKIKNINLIPNTTINNIGLKVKNDSVIPERIYTNDIEVNQNEFLAFGENFYLQDAFYIGSEEVFTKKSSHIKVSFNLSYQKNAMEQVIEQNNIDWKLVMKQNDFMEIKEHDIYIEQVIWEYWNGDGWAKLNIEGAGHIFSIGDERKIELQFICPNDFDKTFINAHENYWLRVRILKVKNAFKINGNYIAPLLKGLNLSYNSREQYEADCLMVKDNLEFKQIQTLGNSLVSLFEPIALKKPAVYLGFDKPLINGPIKILFQILNKNQCKMPLLKWEYYGIVNGKNQWIEMKIWDETNHLNHSGLVTIVIENPFVSCRKFGKEKYFIRIINIDEGYKNEEIEIYPKIIGIHLNTVKIIQKTDMENEFFIINENSQHIEVNLMNEGIYEVKVWVKEILIDDNADLVVNKVEETNETWVLWQEVENFIQSNSEARHYQMDRNIGKITFGDGINGKIPPSIVGENIHVEYNVINGEKGNVEPNKLNNMIDDIPLIDEVTNLDYIVGGNDVEQLESAISRGRDMMYHQNRAVSVKDYESLTKMLCSNALKVKCISHINELGQREIGSMTIVLVLKNYNKGFDYFNNEKANLLAKLKSYSNPMLIGNGKLKVIEATYIEISVEVEIEIEDFNQYQSTWKKCEEMLNEFLNPITGNYNGQGWSIGELPNVVKVRQYIKNIKNIIKIGNIYINAFETKYNSKYAIDLESFSRSEFAIPVNGEHIISIKMKK